MSKKKAKKKPRDLWSPRDPNQKSPLAELAEYCEKNNIELSPPTKEEREKAEKELEEKLKPYRAGNCIMYIKGLGYRRV